MTRDARPGRWRKTLRTYGPTFRWSTFRLHGEPPTGRWIPLRVTQIIGGRSWSLVITRTGNVQDPRSEPTIEQIT